MRLKADRRRRIDGIGEMALGVAAEVAYVGALIVIGALVCAVCLAIHA